MNHPSGANAAFNVRKFSTFIVLFTIVFTSMLVASSSLCEAQANKIHLEYRPVKGEAHPDFILPSIAGDKDVQLSSFRGKKVLLLHFASW